LAQLDREAERERAAVGAFGTRFELGAQQEAQERDIAARREFQGTELGFRGRESALERVQRGELAFAELTSNEKLTTFTQLLSAVFRGEELSQQDKQFFAKLSQDKEIAGQERELRDFIARLSGGGDPRTGDLGTGLNALSTGVGVAQGGLDLGADIASIFASK